MSRLQEAPNAVQIELSQGCNLGCSFCGIHAIGYDSMKRGVDFMTVDTAVSLARQMKEAGWNPRIEFAMHGEPTLHPDKALIIRAFRDNLPRAYIMMTSNGGGLLKDTEKQIDEMFSAGLNMLALDNYQTVKIVPKIVEKLTGITIDQFWEFWKEEGAARLNMPSEPLLSFYPEDPLANPHTRRSDKFISIVRDISVAVDGTHATLNNHAGSAAPLNDRGVGKKCAKPFRELSVRWDGNVALCCNDWPGVYRCGNIKKDGLLAVWNGPEMDAARRMLYLGRREMAPCKGCDATSYRVGLLPDRLGKEEMPAPDATTARIIAAALKKGPYTKPVRGPLEN